VYAHACVCWIQKSTVVQYHGHLNSDYNEAKQHCYTAYPHRTCQAQEHTGPVAASVVTKQTVKVQAVKVAGCCSVGIPTKPIQAPNAPNAVWPLPH
jgi:hypothetical protein